MEKSPDLVALGKTVRRLRKGAKLTQEELAASAGLSANYVGEIERGERNMSITAVISLAQALHVHPSALLAELRA